MLVAKFGPEQHGCSHPVTVSQKPLIVLCLEACPLAFHVVEVLVTKDDVIRLIEFPLHVIHHSPFWSKATQSLGRVAHGAIGIGNQEITRLGVVHVGYIFFIQVPGFRGGMPLAVELVMPSEIQPPQLVVSLLTTVERVQAAVEIVTARAPGVANTGVSVGFASGSPTHGATSLPADSLIW